MKRKYTDTEKAIKLLSRALNIFEELNKTKKDDRYDKIIQKNEFYYKCEEMYNICKVNLKKANEILLSSNFIFLFLPLFSLSSI